MPLPQATRKRLSKISFSTIPKARKQRRRARISISLSTNRQAIPTKSQNFTTSKSTYRAAVIYYNEVIRQQPGSKESDEAKKRIDQLRAKFGDAKLQPAISVSQNVKKKTDTQGARNAGTGSARPGAPNNEAPLPSSESDSSLPPPASLAPDTTTAPEPLLPLPGTSTSSNPSNASGASAPPEASASPAP